MTIDSSKEIMFRGEFVDGGKVYGGYWKYIGENIEAFKERMIKKTEERANKKLNSFQIILGK